MKLLCLILAAISMASACTLRGFRPPPDLEEEYTSQVSPTLAQVRQALAECGFSQPLRQKGGESLDNARARVNECMFLRGFYFKSGDGGYCSDPNYRAKLPACANAPIRSRYSYYGQAPSEHEQRKLDQDMANAIKKYKAEEARSVELSFGEESVRFLNPAKLSNERTMQDGSDCNAYQKAIAFSGTGQLDKEKYQSVECMLAKGYPLEDGKGRCNWPGWREQLSVCAPYAAAYAEDQNRVYNTFKTEGWPYISFIFVNPQKHVMRRVRLDMDQCWSEGTADFRTDWTARRIQALECMQTRGYQFVLEQPNFSCKNVDYKKSSICLGQAKSSD